MNNCSRLLFVAILSFFLLSEHDVFSQSKSVGILTGGIVDGDSGEALVGAVVQIEGTKIGGICDLDGKFRLTNVPAGTHVLVASMVGFTSTKVTGVIVTAGKVTKIDMVLNSDAVKINEVVVKAQSIKNTESSLLNERQKANAVSDAISAETISRSGNNNAADAMKQVTGASVVDGKNVYVRGLGDRYTTTQMNGSEIPSSNPYKKSAPMDLFPSNLLDNITTVKTFTPDKPGNFSGGTVDITTKSYPESFTLSASASSSMDPGSTFNDGFLTYKGGSKDWFGMDDGTRDIPDIVSSTNTSIPNIGNAQKNKELAYKLDKITKSFNGVMSPVEKSMPLNQNYSVSVGNQVGFLGRPLGFLGSFSYSRNYGMYEDGKVNKWNLPNKATDSPNLINIYSLKDKKGSDEVLWGGLATISYKPKPEHNLSLNFIYNRNSEDNARYLYGPYPEQLEDSIYETRTLYYTERGLNMLQLSGQHRPEILKGVKIDWKTSVGSSFQNEPDFRLFNTIYRVTGEGDNKKTVYAVPLLWRPSRYYRKLNDDQRDGNIDITIPFKQWAGKQSNIKLGGLYSHSERTFHERRFQYNLGSQMGVSDSLKVKYNNDPYDYFSDNSIGLIDSTKTLYYFGNYILEASDPANNYDGDQDIKAGYGMLDIDLTKNLRFIGGARLESTEITVASQDTTKKKGCLSENDVLPSMNFVYQLSENVNLRAAYGKTLARPTFRELAPYATFDFFGDFTFIGNPDLKRTLIDNYDFRWEWFSRPGEIFAISFFYKDFTNPIERAISPFLANGEATFLNVDKATVYGTEIELRKQLDQLGNIFKFLSLGTNLSLIHSEVDIPPAEYRLRQQFYANPPKKREFAGQSPYVFNIDFGYNNDEKGTSASLYYNVFGERLSTVSQGGTPDVYEQPVSLLNFSFTQKVYKNLNIKFSAKNILNSSSKKTQNFKGKEYIYEEYKPGATFSAGLSYIL